MAAESERPASVAAAAHVLGRELADVIAYAVQPDTIVLVFRQGDKRRVPLAQIQPEPPAPEAELPMDAEPVEPINVAAETGDPAAPLYPEPAVAAETGEPAKPKTSRRGGGR